MENHSEVAGRALLYVHYNSHNGLYEHVVYQLQKLRAVFSNITFISNSPLSSVHKNALRDCVDDIMERANFGFDFYAWKEALDRVDHHSAGQLAGYSSVTLMNDTCFGPLNDLQQIYDEMAHNSCDFWGQTNQRKGSQPTPELGDAAPEHIQRHFMVFNANVVQSLAWRHFWNDVQCESDLARVTEKYELQLTRKLREAGFKYSVLLDTRTLDLLPHEISCISADYCIGEELPFLKIKSLVRHENKKYIVHELQRRSGYPKRLIEDFASRAFQPDLALSYCNKALNVHAPVRSRIQLGRTVKIAVHVHAFYVDLWNRYLDYFEQFGFSFDIFVTTDSEAKALVIRRSIEARAKFDSALTAISIIENLGRDVVPWLSIAEKLNRYDVVLHAHTKKTPHAAGWIGASWQQDIFDSMLQQADHIVQEFETNPRLGIAMPDLPYFWRYISPLRPAQAANLVPMMNSLWARMKCERAVDFSNAMTFIMPYGTMFWYRPQALTKLTTLKLAVSEVPPEPLPEVTVLHAMERLPVYVAWAAGFDFTIVPTPEVALGFSEVIARNLIDARTPHVEPQPNPLPLA